MNLNAICIGINSRSSNETARYRSLALDFASPLQPFDPRITYSGASARMYYDSTGTLKYAPMNLIRNNAMVGAVAGTPGTLPTNWVAALQGLTQTIVGTGTENGVSYIDINLAGTTTSTNPTIIFESSTQVAALTGQVWTAATYVAIVGGTLTGVTDTRQVISERTAAGAVVTNQLGTARTIDSALTRYTDTVTLSGGATTAYIYSAVRLTIATSTAVNITLRIGMPQLQRGSEATPAIPTTTAAVYLPRSNAYQDHDPSTLEPLGFLIEEQRTNSLVNNTMQGAVVGTIGSGGALPTGWTGGSGASLVYEVIGTGTEDGINYIDVRASGTASASVSQNFALPASVAASIGQLWAGSAFVRIVNGTTAGISSWILTITERDSGGAQLVAQSVSFAPTSMALRTQRVTGTRTLTNASTALLQTGIRIVPISGATVDITLRIGLPQLELGAFATSPILTSGAAATRLVDSASMTGTDFSSWFNPVEGTFVCQFIANANASAARLCVDANNGTASTRISTGRSTTLKGQLFAGISGSTEVNQQTTNDVGSPAKVATVYKVDDFAVCANGGTVATDTLGAVPTVSQMNFGMRADTGGNINGHIQQLTIYRKRLANAILQQLTS